MKPITTKDIDSMIFFFTKQPPGTFAISDRQAEVIRQGWSALHAFDKNHTYTFNEKFNMLKKETL